MNPSKEIADLTKFLNENKYPVDKTMDGTLHRFDREGHNSGFLSLKLMTHKGRDIVVGVVGDWKTGEMQVIRTTGGIDLDKAEESEFNEALKLAKEKAYAEKQKVWSEVAPQYEQEFATFADSGETPYLRRKGITALWGAKIKPNPNGDPIVCVPLRDVDGKFWNYQRIYSQKLSKGDKFFQADGKIEGCFHLLHDKPIAMDDAIYVAEGFATAASIRTALGDEHPVVCAFNAGNLRPVTQSLHEKYPDAKIIVCADNDHATIIKGKPDNVGLRYGRAAAGNVKGDIRYPRFKYLDKHSTDFNDLALVEGLEMVKDQILNPKKYIKEIEPMCLSVSRSGKIILPTEKEMSDYILNFFGDDLIRQDKSLFVYNGSHWYELDIMGIAKFQQKIGVAANHELTMRDIKNHYEYILAHCSQVPRGVNLFQPNPNCANFVDGTLHIEKTGRLTFKKEFAPHSRRDFLLATLPFKYPQGELLEAGSPLFDEMLQNLWKGDVDSGEKIRFYKQLLGNSLTPLFSRIVFFVGHPGSGKSTLIKVLVKLVGYENCSTVQPCDMNGFNLASMPGKLINYDTDIDVNRPINDSLLKKIIDRVPFRVRRKNRDDVHAYIAPLHLYACNSLPPTLDGASKALERRFSVIRTSSWRAPEKHDFDFEDHLLETEGQGIARVALHGLEELIKEGGHFTNPESSLKETQSMQMQSDVVEQFIKAIEEKEVKGKTQLDLIFDAEAKIKRTEAWEMFRQWCDENFQGAMLNRVAISRVDFCSRMRSKGFTEAKVRGEWFFKGLGLQVEPDAVC